VPVVLSSKLREEETKGEMSSLHSEKKEPDLESGMIACIFVVPNQFFGSKAIF
jgi:hypothetical protein